MRTSEGRTLASQGAALQYAFKLLSYRGRSEKEMAERLRLKGFEDSAVGGVIDHLRSAGLLDDRKLAASLKRYAAESKHLGKLGAKRFLAVRGIPQDIIEEAIGDIDECETARRLVEKKMSSWRKHPSPGEPREFTPDQLTPEMVRKLYGLLARRGYPPGTIRKTLEQIKYKEDVR